MKPGRGRNKNIVPTFDDLGHACRNVGLQDPALVVPEKKLPGYLYPEEVEVTDEALAAALNKDHDMPLGAKELLRQAFNAGVGYEAIARTYDSQSRRVSYQVQPPSEIQIAS